MRSLCRKMLFLSAMLIVLLICPLQEEFAYASIDDTVSSTDGITVNGFRYELQNDDTMIITGYQGSSKNLEIPDVIDGKLVSAIDELAFYVDDIETISIPGSVVTIGEKAFSYCNDLKKVTFREEGLTNIGSRAFESCDFTEFEIPGTVTSIGECAFVNTMKLQRISIPASVTSMGRALFSNSAIAEIDLKEGLTFVGDSMFQGCRNLTSAVIPESVTVIMNSAFSHCSNLATATLPRALKSIDKNCFYATNIGTIRCYPNSKAHDFAMTMNYTVELLGPHFKNDEIILYIGNKEKLKVVNATKTIDWKSSKKNVVKVSQDGTVEAIGKGTATITATDDGATISCKITVKDLSISKSKVTITTGKKTTLKVVGADKAPVWKSSNTKIATVSSKGVVTGKAAGSATITATAYGKKYTCKVSVKSNVATFEDYQDTSYDGLTVNFTKIYYSGDNMILEGYVSNNTTNMASKITNISIKVYSHDTVVAAQTFEDYKLSLKAYSRKKVKFTIKSKNVKSKKLDLRIDKINYELNGSYIYYY